MTERVMKFVREQIERLDIEGPVLEYGSMQVSGQEGLGDLRKYLTDIEFIGCDMRPGLGVDRIDNMEHSAFPPDYAGAIFCLETLEHVQHPWQALKETHRILKPGGLLIVSVPFRIHIHDYPDDYWRMTSSALSLLLREAGFEDIEAWDNGEELIDGFPYPMSSFGVCRKGVRKESTDLYRASAITREKTYARPPEARERVPIIIPL